MKWIAALLTEVALMGGERYRAKYPRARTSR